MVKSRYADLYYCDFGKAGDPLTLREKVRVHELSLSFPHAGGRLRVLDRFNLTVYDGEFVSIVGPSGCGKSTLLRLVNGLIRPDAGEVFLDGRPVTGVPDNVGLVFQNDALLPWYSVYDNIRLALVMRGVPKENQPRRIHELIAMVGLEGFADQLPGTLSGGMRKRVALARALAYDPDVFLMDEPFGPLDAQTRISVGQEFLRIWQSLGKSVLFVTHDIEEAVALSDRVVVLSPRPARVIGDFSVDLPRPRDFYEIRFEPEFQRLHREIYQCLIQEAKAAFSPARGVAEGVHAQ